MDSLEGMHDSDVSAIIALAEGRRFSRDAFDAFQEASSHMINADIRGKLEALRNTCRNMVNIIDELSEELEAEINYALDMKRQQDQKLMIA